MDRRVKYTQMVLSDSFLKFLEQKPIEKITVTEICKEADINRSTYYSYYSDPFDQFTKMKANLLEELAQFTEQFDTDEIPSRQRQYKLLVMLLQYVEKKRNTFRILLTKNGDHNIQHDLLVFLGEKIFPIDLRKENDKIKNQYYLIYVSNGCFGMFYHWLTDDHPISSEKLAHLMAEFARNVIP